jgi:hypothetical protein
MFTAPADRLPQNAACTNVGAVFRIALGNSLKIAQESRESLDIACEGNLAKCSLTDMERWNTLLTIHCPNHHPYPLFQVACRRKGYDMQTRRLIV